MARVDNSLVCVDIVGVSRLLSELLGTRLAAFGVSIGQLPTLLALYDADGRTQAELARAIGVEQPTMAATLRRMERDGLIRRIPDPGDRRRARVQLTDRALAMRDELQAQRAAIDELALAGLSARDRHTLPRMLATMTANLVAAARDS